VFLHGHYLYLAVRHREVFGESDLDASTRRVASALAGDYGLRPLLLSYRDMTYVADNWPALAALRRYDAAFGESLSDEPAARAVAEVKARYVDPETGLVACYVDREARRITEGPRGVATMYGLMFLPEVDAGFAREQWRAARSRLVRDLSRVIAERGEGYRFLEALEASCRGRYVCLEHPEREGMSEAERDLADGDSGPVVLGVGASASGFLIAAARRNGDERVARGAEELALTIGNPRWVDDRLYYRDMFHPVGQAVVLYGKSLGVLPR